MPGRHATTTRRRQSRVGPILASVVAVAVIIALGIYLAPRLTDDGSGNDCDEPQEVSVAAPSDIAPAVRRALTRMRDGGHLRACLAVSVSTIFPDSAISQINANSNSTPTVWILDTKARLAELQPQTRRRTELIGSAGQTLLAIGASVRAEQSAPSSWLAAFESDEFVMPSPLGSIASTLAIAAVNAEGNRDRLDTVLVEVAKRIAEDETPVPNVGTLLRHSRFRFGTPRWFPVTEQRFVNARLRHVNWQLRAFIPGSGTVVLDYPIVTRRDADPAATETAQQLSEFMTTTGGKSVLGAAGFRTPRGQVVNAAALVTKPKILKAPTELAGLRGSWSRAQDAATD